MGYLTAHGGASRSRPSYRIFFLTFVLRTYLLGVVVNRSTLRVTTYGIVRTDSIWFTSPAGRTDIWQEKLLVTSQRDTSEDTKIPCHDKIIYLMRCNAYLCCCALSFVPY